MAPRGFEEWRKSWRVFRTGMLKLDASLAGLLDTCEEGVRVAAASYPRWWDHICTVEDVMRMERWEIVRARIEAQVERKTNQGEWDPERPWGTVMSHTAYSSGLDSAWWFN